MITLRALLVAATVVALGNGTVFAACTYPEAVDVPDGSKASTEEMVAGQKRVKAYMADMEAYLNCLDEEEKELGDAVTEEQHALHIQRHNAAVDAMESVANAFNEQIRAYKAAKN